LIYMLVGVHVIGAATDYYSGMYAVKNEGKSMGELASEKIHYRTGTLLTFLYFLAGLMVTSMFVEVMADTVVGVPESGLPVLLLIPVAMLFGVALKKGFPLGPTTAFFIVILLVVCGIGATFPLALSMNAWMVIFFVYTFGAISAPVWILLAPRDYLNTVLVIGGLLLGAAALLIFRPGIQLPAFTSFNTIRGPLWPMMMATITCGAASGVHQLISFGTTARQLDNEKDGYFVMYGGMQSETFMAVISAGLIMVLFSYDGFLEEAYTAPGAAFSNALGNSLELFGMDPVWGATIGALTFGALLLTTLDSWARNARYLLQEMTRSTLGKNRMATNFVFILIAVVVLLYTPVMDLWSGIALSSITLLTVPLSLLLVDKIEKGEPFDGKFKGLVIAPLVFIYPSAIAAIIHELYRFVMAGNWISFILMVFMAYIVFSLAYYTFSRISYLKKQRETN